MKASRLFMPLVLVFMLAFGTTAFGAIIGVTDLQPGDLNSIVSQSPPGTYPYEVVEDYRETHRIPYPSHDGYAIVNAQDGFFEKLVKVDTAGQHIINFEVRNNTPYKWSDYHFLIDTTDLFFLLDASSDRFDNQSFVGTELSFWAPEWILPGEIVNFNLNILLTTPNDFQITQIATTVPVPGAVWLLGSGLLGLVGLRRKLKK